MRLSNQPELVGAAGNERPATAVSLRWEDDEVQVPDFLLVSIIAPQD